MSRSSSNCWKVWTLVSFVLFSSANEMKNRSKKCKCCQRPKFVDTKTFSNNLADFEKGFRIAFTRLSQRNTAAPASILQTDIFCHSLFAEFTITNYSKKKKKLVIKLFPLKNWKQWITVTSWIFWFCFETTWKRVRIL